MQEVREGPVWRPLPHLEGSLVSEVALRPEPTAPNVVRWRASEDSALAILENQRSGLAGFLPPRSPGLETSNKVGRP